MRWVAWYLLAVGSGIAVLWTVLLVTRQVPEVQDGDMAIRFHLAAEAVLASSLIGAGVALLAGGGVQARVLAGVGLGALVYSALNSPGYYAAQRRWDMVAFFGVVVAATAAALVVVLRAAAT
jgi:hypothetical protein